MKEVTVVTLENEMDIIVAHKRMARVAEYFSLSVSTQTTVATAVAEVCRVVIDKTDAGILTIGMERMDGKFFLVGSVAFPLESGIKAGDDGFEYAKRLVPEFNFQLDEYGGLVEVKIGIPRSLKVSDLLVKEAGSFFSNIRASSPYEELKIKNSVLNQQAAQKEAELRNSKIIDEKKNEFISVASHELKTPLTSIKAFTKLALNTANNESSEKVKKYLQKIDLQVNKLHTLIQQLLDVSKIESGKLDYQMEEVEWNQFMQDTIAVLEQLVPLHKVFCRLCEKKVVAHIDKLRMEQVLTNLVINAAKYSAPGSQIDIHCFSGNDTLNIVIKDSGIGMSEATLARLFEKYYRAPEVADKYSGFGMGLYITAGIIKEHGGTIYAESIENNGSSFHIKLPLRK